MDLKEQIKATLVKELDLIDINPAEIDDEAPLFGDEGLGLDSLDAVEIVVLIHKFFKAEIQDMEQGQKALQSINSLTAFIQENQ
ncbi:phosphopantetheine-binding protein [Pseudodesulfovibrio sediminis]|uniref:Acyl carrier protein n=1 Tax=Pseudodesulfovibrio sediminis TaxID=2810563 RepID=A0ABM7P681_9BACT|nr:phosphopantetheine-binding protein [Pseudodesulfovibrio sediminis]BCS88450.1 acyl carrier protein [Pseudodesulfovibrio sediminis]